MSDRPESLRAFPDPTAQRGLPSTRPHILINEKVLLTQAFVPRSAPEIVPFTLATETNPIPTNGELVTATSTLGQRKVVYPAHPPSPSNRAFWRSWGPDSPFPSPLCFLRQLAQLLVFVFTLSFKQGLFGQKDVTFGPESRTLNCGF